MPPGATGAAPAGELGLLCVVIVLLVAAGWLEEGIAAIVLSLFEGVGLAAGPARSLGRGAGAVCDAPGMA